MKRYRYIVLMGLLLSSAVWPLHAEETETIPAETEPSETEETTEEIIAEEPEREEAVPEQTEIPAEGQVFTVDEEEPTVYAEADEPEPVQEIVLYQANEELVAPAAGGWKNNTIGWWYEKADGSYYLNEWAIIDGLTYHFNSSGYMDRGWYSESGNWYYLGNDGAMRSSCWEGLYYLKEDGSMAHGEWVDNGRYYVNASGQWVKGYGIPVWRHNARGWWCEDGYGSYYRNTWVTISGKTYHFNSAGYMNIGWYKENGNWYYLGKDGAMRSSCWEGHYYLKEDGSMAHGEWVDNGRYYVNASGKWVRGYAVPVWRRNARGWWCEDGYGSYYRNRWVTISGKTYHFNSTGYMNTGWYKENGNWYYLGKDGVMRSSCWAEGLYYLKEDGSMAHDEWVEGEKYYVGADGKWIKDYGIPRWEKNARGWWYNSSGYGSYPVDEWMTIDDREYHFGKSGYMDTGWYKENDVWYYLGKDGAKKSSCWVESVYYLKEDGSMAHNEWVENEKYYVGADGRWIRDYGIPHWTQNARGWWYNSDGYGSYPVSQWMLINGSYYHFDANGYMQKGWIKTGGSWYYLESSGAMATGWKKLGGKYYYLGSSGAMHTGWLEDKGKTYYLDSSGAMVTGLQYIDGKSYFFSRSSGAMQPFDGFSLVYYSQLDPSWSSVRYGSYTFGSTGCGITSIAMALSTVLSQSILPTDVANYMYYQTSEYNSACAGNTGRSNLLGAAHWGANCDIINSESEMAEALRQGKVLTVMVNPGTFTPAGTTHEMVLFGLSGGSTYVYDPLGGRGNGWYSTSQMWNERSTDPYDRNVGTGVFSFY